MNIEAYNLDSLRKLVRKLQAEIIRMYLKGMLLKRESVSSYQALSLHKTKFNDLFTF